MTGPRFHVLRTDRHPASDGGYTHPATCHDSRAAAEQHIQDADPPTGGVITEWRVTACTCGAE